MWSPLFNVKALQKRKELILHLMNRSNSSKHLENFDVQKKKKKEGKRHEIYNFLEHILHQKIFC